MDLTIVSPRGGRDVGNASYVSLWTTVGQMGVLRGHADFVGEVAAGIVRAATPEGDLVGVAGWGVVRIADGRVHLAVEHWADERPDTEQIEARLHRLAGELQREDLPAGAAARAHREIAFLEHWLAKADRLGG